MGRIKNFIYDIKIYNNINKGKNSIQYLCDKFKVLQLFYSLRFHDNIIKKPNNNKIFLYKQKKSSHFIGIINNDNKIAYYDLENNGKELDNYNYNDLIDLDCQYVYILEYKNTRKRVGPSNNLDDFQNLDFLINNISEKEKFIYIFNLFWIIINIITKWKKCSNTFNKSYAIFNRKEYQERLILS